MIIEILGLVFSIIVGTIGHFLYDLTNHNKVIGFLFSTNESTFEHIKLGITPILIWTIIELFTFNYNCLFFAKFISIMVFIFTLLIFYYGYKFFIKKNILFLDILIFYMSLAISYYSSIIMMLKFSCHLVLNLFGFMGIIIILFVYKRNNDKNIR